jgi:hypothetical protein
MIIAIDVSGSTSTRIHRSLDSLGEYDEETIFTAEKKIASFIENYFARSTSGTSRLAQGTSRLAQGASRRSVYIGWDEESNTYDRLDDVELTGQGTNPDCLYDNPAFVQNMNTSHVVLFTDGIIDESGIATFYEKMSEQNTNAVFTFCIVSGRKNTKVSDIDVSVAFPVISLSRKAVFLYYDPYNCNLNTPRVIHTINTSVNCTPVTENSKWSDYPHLDETDLNLDLDFTQTFSSKHTPIPKGKIRLDTEEFDDIVELVDDDSDETHQKVLAFENNYVLATFVYKCKGELRRLGRILRTFILSKNCDFCKKWVAHINKMKHDNIGTTSRVFSCSR